VGNAQLWYDRGAWQIGSLSELGINAFLEAERDLTQALRLATNVTGSASARPLLPIFAKKSTLQSPLAWVYYNRAYARVELERYEDARDDITHAITLDGSDADAYMMRAQIWSKLGDWQHAKSDWEQALSLNPDHRLKFVVEADICVNRQDYEKALQLMTEIVARPLFWPLHRPEMHLQRGQIYEHMGQTEKAMSDYCHYLLWRPEAREANRLKQKLADYREHQ
jgi:Tfp pilus assembly protein PilF